MKVFLSIVLLCFGMFSDASAQLKLDFGAGNLEGIYPWGDGTLVCKRAGNGGFVSKEQILLFFDKTGSKIWEKSIKNFNSSNKIVVSKDSKYAYFINLSFVKSNASEKSSDKEPIRINRVDRAGTIQEFVISETQLKPILVKNIVRFEFGLCSEDQLILLFSTAEPETKELQEFNLVQFKGDASINVKKIEDLSMNYKDWRDLKNSHPKFIHQDSESFYIIQNNFESGAMLFKTSQIDLKDLSTKKTINFDVVLNKISGIGESKGISSFHEDFGPSYEYSWLYYASNSSYPTLEAFYSTKVKNDKIYLYGNISQEKECTGIWYTTIDLRGGTEQLQRPESILFSNFPAFPINRNKQEGPITSMNLDVVDGKFVCCVHNSKDFNYYKFEAGIMNELLDKGIVSTSIPLNQKVYAAFKDHAVDENASVYIYNNGQFNIYVVLDGVIECFIFE